MILDYILNDAFMPHGYCLGWQKDLLFMMLLGDGLTVIAYSIIPVALMRMVKKRDDLKFDSMFILFAAFIAFCGLTRLISIINIWQGYYVVQILAKLITGLVSMLTAIVFWRLMPKILAIPSSGFLNLQNDALRLTQERLEEVNRDLEQKVKERTESLQKLANTDQLTQVKNRRAILETLEYEFQRMQRQPQSLSLLLLDIDHFKAINDNFGHLEGDKVLAETARIITHACRLTDSVGRYGGEEFLIVLPETTLADAKNLAERIRIAVMTCDTKNKSPLTCSIGVSTVKSGSSILQCIKEADDRTYIAKRCGRNQVIHDDLDPEIPQ